MTNALKTLTLGLALGAAALAGCEKTTAEKAKDVGRDAKDVAKDAARDVNDAAKDAGRDANSAAKDAGRKIGDAAQDAKDAMKDAGKAVGDKAKEAAARLLLVTAKVVALEARAKALETDGNPGPAQRDIRNGCRDILTLYADESGEAFEALRKRAKAVLDAIPN